MAAQGGQPALSLILASYGRADDIGRLVASLAAQTERSFELIVVDQNLDERVKPHVDRARQLGLDVQHLRLTRPNLSAARNRGLAAARGEWVAFPDDDCWYEPETLACLREAAGAQAEASILVADWVEAGAAARGSSSEQTGPLSLRAWRNFRGGDASSITLFMRRHWAERLGGFDERLGVGQWFGSGEETDLVLSALSHGARAERAPRVRVHHAHAAAASLDRLSARQIWAGTLARARGTGAVYAKHRLSATVIARGLLAPWVNALLGLLSRRHGLGGMVQAAALTLGRWQGWRQWSQSGGKISP
jgi:GT2 family glycosyltransferase